MNVVREINKINEAELALGVTGSWHDEYKDSAYVFVGGLNTELTEGDVITIMSQFGEISNINLPRNKETGAPRGFAFIMYADQRSTILAVDNLNGASVLGRTLRVDHVKDYKQGRVKNDEGEWVDKDDEEMNALPQMQGVAEESENEEESDDGIDPEDPMAGYLKAKRAEEKKKQKKKGKSKHEGETKEERRARKKAKKEKKARKEKGKTEGVRAVEALLANFGRGERSPPPKRRREDSLDRDNSPRSRRRRDDSPPRRTRDDSPPMRSRGDSSRPSRDDTLPRYGRDASAGPPRHRDDDSPPRRYRNDTPPLRRVEDPPFRRRDDTSPPRRYRDDRSPPRRPREESTDRSRRR